MLLIRPRRASVHTAELNAILRAEPHPRNQQGAFMKSKRGLILSSLVLVLLTLAASVSGQVHKYFSPGSVWGVTMLRIHPGMDQAYLEYLDTQLKKESDVSIKNGFMKSYKILRSQDDDAGWNMLILREYESYASLEKNEEKADEVLRQATGIDDQKGMQGYMDRSKVRDVVGTKFMREVVLK
jgi:hypothetical protein